MAVVYWDKEEALSRFSNSDATLKHLVTVFMECMPNFLESLNRSIEKNDFKSIAFNAHSIKGSAANISAKEIARVTKAIEVVAKYSEDEFDLILRLKDELTEIWAKTVEVLDEYIASLENDDKVAFSSDTFYGEIKKLQESLKHGEFVDSSTLNMFHTDVSLNLQQKLQKLERDIDMFKTKEALVLIDEILKEETK